MKTSTISGAALALAAFALPTSPAWPLKWGGLSPRLRCLAIRLTMRKVMGAALRAGYILPFDAPVTIKDAEQSHIAKH